MSGRKRLGSILLAAALAGLLLVGLGRVFASQTPGSDLIATRQDGSSRIPEPKLPAASPGESNPRFVLFDHFGGATYHVVVSGTYAYLAAGPRLLVMDYSNTAQPFIAGRSEPIFGNIRRIVIKGSRAYVVGESLAILDLSNPVRPVIVGELKVHGLDLAVSGDLVFFADRWSGLRIIDVSVPSSPVEVTIYEQPDDFITAVEARGRYAYVADFVNGLSVLDTINPSAPVEIWSMSNSYFIDITDLAIEGDNLFAVVYHSPGYLHRLSLSNPAAPAGKGVKATDGRPTYLSVDGDYAYVSNADYPPPGGGSVGIRIFDVSGWPMTEVGYYDQYETGHDAQDDLLFVPWAGLQIADVSMPSTPIKVGQYIYPDPFDVAVGSQHYFMTNIPFGMSIAERDNPGFTEAILFEFGDFARDLALSNTLVLIAEQENGLRLVDVSDPLAPATLSQIDTPERAMSLSVKGNHVFVADSDGGLRVIDISDPVTPFEVGSLSGRFFAATDMIISGTLLYVNGYDHIADANLQIIDISIPSSPTYVSKYGERYPFYTGIAISRSLVFASHSGGLDIIDVSMPATPTIVTVYTGTGTLRDVAVDGNFAYVTDDDAGLRAIDISQPDSPFKVDTFEHLGGETVSSLGGEIIVFEDRIYVAGAGLYILGFLDLDETAFLPVIAR